MVEGFALAHSDWMIVFRARVVDELCPTVPRFNRLSYQNLELETLESRTAFDSRPIKPSDRLGHDVEGSNVYIGPSTVLKSHPGGHG